MDTPCRVTADLIAHEADQDRRAEAWGRHGDQAITDAAKAVVDSQDGPALVVEALGEADDDDLATIGAYALEGGRREELGALTERIVGNYLRGLQCVKDAAAAAVFSREAEPDDEPTEIERWVAEKAA